MKRFRRSSSVHRDLDQRTPIAIRSRREEQINCTNNALKPSSLALSPPTGRQSAITKDRQESLRPNLAAHPLDLNCEQSYPDCFKNHSSSAVRKLAVVVASRGRTTRNRIVALGPAVAGQEIVQVTQRRQRGCLVGATAG